MPDEKFWNQKRVFITGHTGFKGTWLSLWLHSLGAVVTGYALEAPTTPSLFEVCEMDRVIRSHTADIRDREKLQKALLAADPDVVFHMAAKPLVRDSYQNPVETYEVNVMGTVYLLEAVRTAIMLGGSNIKAVINVTTDKCYENKELTWRYRESDPLSGRDPYSSSKACSELITMSYRNSFFQPNVSSGTNVATVRAGNVIGGGDWAKDRLIPDCVRAMLTGTTVSIRNPDFVRPWQHVLEPLSGYMLLAQHLIGGQSHYAGAWNFGPRHEDEKTVNWIVEYLSSRWGSNFNYTTDIEQNPPYEAQHLILDCSKALLQLNWQPKWNLPQALDKIIEWVQGYQDGKDIRGLCIQQIQEYMYS
ncbi:CDP-glucose 4,6-dehydratase [Alicyclobacillus tolerans]|uniref:CDP-glucose 4,6-dehydratase n=1 Tax=Alicyclobacillus tolerans TaxID=90970 RepID=UPI001F026E57|nr:CDP-glucose 4,6-dehydratase [Alicyclobacillus tolerans]MCF8567632.1 CDP-glucose 4,6-dehydratase [Alicyclobacillus tolerans]